MSQVYSGSLKNGLYHGKGELNDPIAGFSYKGDFKKGLMHGDGTKTWHNGFVYNGWFKSGHYHGKGILKYPDGSLYTGEFLNGLMEGVGKLSYVNIGVYEGEYSNGKRHGRGHMQYKDGSSYTGQFKNDRREGQGMLNFPNGCSYDGHFENDNLNGQGVWSFPCGGRFECVITAGILDGWGSYQDHLGNRFSGRFNEGKLLAGKIHLRHASKEQTSKYGIEQSVNIQDEHITEIICSLSESIDYRIERRIFSLPNNPDFREKIIHQLIKDVLLFNIKEKLKGAVSRLNLMRVRDILDANDIELPSDILPVDESDSMLDMATNLKKCHFLFFDTETTGLPKNYEAPVHDLANWPRLVQLAFIGYDSAGVELFKGNRLIRPDNFTIPTDAAQIHGITTEKALNTGSDLTLVLKEFEELATHSSVIVAHNMDFDDKIVGSELIRMGFKNILAEKKKICTMKSSTSHCKINGPYGYKWPKLSELHSKLFGFEFKEAHNAAVDIEATAKCFWKLVELDVIKNESAQQLNPGIALAHDLQSQMDSDFNLSGMEHLNANFYPEDHNVFDDNHNDSMEDYWLAIAEQDNYGNDNSTNSFRLSFISSFTEQCIELNTDGQPKIEHGALKKVSRTLYKYGIVGASIMQKELYRRYTSQGGFSNYSEINGHPIYISGNFLGNECVFNCTIHENGTIQFLWDSSEIDALKSMAQKYPNLAPTIEAQIRAIMLNGSTLRLDGF